MTDYPRADRFFTLTEQAYKREIEPVCHHKGIHPRTLIQFRIELPFYFPFPERHWYSIVTEHDVLCTYQFFEHIETRRMVSLPPESPSWEVNRSFVEMLYITNDEVGVGKDEGQELTACFDTLIDTLNVLLLSYLIKSKDNHIYRVSKEMLNHLSMCRIIDGNNWSNVHDLIFFLHQDIPYRVTPVDTEKQLEVLGFIPAIRDAINPFALQEELYNTAERYIREGFYREACIFAQMTIESFLSTLFTHLLLHEGKTDTEAEQVREELGFIKMVRTGFHPRLGGKWNTDDVHSICGRWYHQTYNLRNRVVHGGYFPTILEARTAITAAQDFRVYIVSLLQQKKKAFPHLARHFAGLNHG